MWNAPWDRMCKDGSKQIPKCKLQSAALLQIKQNSALGSHTKHSVLDQVDWIELNWAKLYFENKLFFHTLRFDS